LEKAIEIKRRAQRFIQSGDLEGALSEYEKLVALPDCDPYNFVLLADLLFKRGDKAGALQRYLAGALAYEKTGLYKNAIAVCKKMLRLGLSPSEVLERLAELHALDGLGTEASLYYQQYAGHLLREQRSAEAAGALRKAFESAPEDLSLLQRVAEAQLAGEDKPAAALTLAEAAHLYQKRGELDAAARYREQAEQLKPGAAREFEARTRLGSGAAPPPPAPADEDEEEEEGPPGPPLLPSLRGEPDEDEAAESEEEPQRPAARPDRERPARAGAAGEAAGRAGRGKSQLLSAAEIEALLHTAQGKLRAGDHEEASRLLSQAAQAYEAVGRYDNAATIFRSLGKSASRPAEVLELWLANCERRDDRREAAEVACELGDLAMQAGDEAKAHQWYARAHDLDENNLLAQRRLQRMAEMRDGAVARRRAPEAPAEPVAEEDLAPTLEPVHADPPRARPLADPAPGLEPVTAFEPPAAERPAEPAAAAAAAEPSPADRVELAVGRSEAVTFDLGSLLSEFQRGIEAQLSGDAQGHYDLAMAYREMGLLDHAVESFRLALGSPEFAGRALEMLGRCLLDQGCFEEAAQELSAALERPGLEADSAINLRYLLGLAYEAAGRTREALAEFERVFAEQSNYHDVALKLRDLRKALEAA
jgi:tetratricopeptide (TPR) repeat protein